MLIGCQGGVNRGCKGGGIGGLLIGCDNSKVTCFMIPGAVNGVVKADE